MPDSPLLIATHIIKSFAGVQALKSAAFELRAGEVHALIGENGAGKSTLIKIITGAVDADGGELFLNGQRITANSPRWPKISRSA
jgi:ABC-type sugar transport system ATPase subunit